MPRLLLDLMHDLSRLLSHLRDTPESRSLPPAELARTFSVPKEMVDLALRALPRAQITAPARAAKKEGAARRASVLRSASWERVLGVGGILVIALALAQIPATGALAVVLALSSLIGSFVVCSLAAWKTGGWGPLLVCSLVPPLSFFLILSPSPGMSSRLGELSFLGVLNWMGGLLLASAASLGGGWTRVHRERKRVRSMDRHAMLTRVLEIRDTMARQSSGAASAVAGALHPLLAKWGWALDLAAGTVLGTGTALALQATSMDRVLSDAQTMQRADDRTLILFTLAWLGTSVLALAIQLGLGGTKSKWPSAAGGGLLNSLGSYLPLFLGLGSTQYREVSLAPASIIGGTVSGVVVYSLGFAGARLKHHLDEKKRREANDPQVLMEELIELQARLRPSSIAVTVLAVDVAGSTKMKAGADPYEAEWCFREYQNVVALAAAEHGGEVISTAGDGAILSFTHPAQALEGARAIHEAVRRFNQDTNRLSSPFLLRIGIHHGEAMGDLGEVQFTSVIDIASHIEASSPVGGAALSEAAYSLAVGEPNAAPAKVVDGQAVYLLDLSS